MVAPTVQQLIQRRLPAMAWLVMACSSPAPPPVDASVQAHNVESVRCSDYASCEFACQEGRGDSCADLARMFETGNGVPQNSVRAAELYEHACSLHNGPACAHLALMYDVGLGVDHDPSSAAYWYETACALGHNWSCSRKRHIQSPDN